MSLYSYPRPTLSFAPGSAPLMRVAVPGSSSWHAAVTKSPQLAANPLCCHPREFLSLPRTEAALRAVSLLCIRIQAVSEEAPE